jgi:hypothetical protein
MDIYNNIIINENSKKSNVVITKLLLKIPCHGDVFPCFFEDTKEIHVKCDKSPIQNHWAIPIISIHLY